MNVESWYYSATDIARPLVEGDVPTRMQYAFLEWLRVNEGPFLRPEWRNAGEGGRAMNLAVQNAIDYLVDPKALEMERRAVEEEGGTLPVFDYSSCARQFMKALRIDMALMGFLGTGAALQKRMKCRTILRRCGVKRRSRAFCREFECAAAFYHIGLRGVREECAFFSIDGVRRDDTMILALL